RRLRPEAGTRHAVHLRGRRSGGARVGRGGGRWILPGDAGLPSPRPEDPGRRGRAHPRLWVGARGLFREVHLYPAYSTAVLQALLLAVADPAISRPPPGGVGCAEIHADSPLHARGGDAGGSREIVGPRTGRVKAG